MNRLMKRLPVLAFALAAIAAFAFNVPQQQGTLKAYENGAWVPITDQVMYRCDEATSDCTAEFDENDQQIEDSETPGEFVRLSIHNP